MADGRYGGGGRGQSMFDEKERGGSALESTREPWGGGDRDERPGGAGSSGDGSSGGRSGGHYLDPHFLGWRERQIRALDQDYDDYCRDLQKQFESDFHHWREKRQGELGAAYGRHSGGESDRGQSGPGAEASAAADTAGGGGDLSASEASTGSSASGAGRPRSGRKLREPK